MSLLPQFDELLELRHRAHTIGIASHHRVDSVLGGLYASVFRGQGMDFEETREYREGDEIRNMDWRVTARTGVPHLKVFREERERAVILCVDVGPHMRFGTRGTFKSVQAARAAALLGWAASSHQDRVGAMLFGGGAAPRWFPPSRARRSLWRMLRTLTLPATASPGGAEEALPAALRTLGQAAPTGALLFIIADFNRDPGSLQVALGRLRQRHSVVLLPVDDVADRDIPDVGKVVFAGPDGVRVEVDTADAQGRRRYAETWQQQRQALELLARRLGLMLIPIPTHEEIHRVVVAGLRRHADRRALRR